MNCPLCEEAFQEGDELSPMANGGKMHRECAFRSVMGGAGHYEDHEYWCMGRQDPDGGRTYRQSAVVVEAKFLSGEWEFKP